MFFYTFILIKSDDPLYMTLGFNGPSGPYKPRPCGQLLLGFAQLSYFLHLLQPYRYHRKSMLHPHSYGVSIISLYQILNSKI